MFLNCFIIALVFVFINDGHAYSSCQFNSNVKLRPYYDFIIVGAGSAGSVVANRLSELPDVTVLLLEAGGEENPILNEVPRLYNQLWNTEQDWQFEIVESSSPNEGNHSEIPIWPKGKVLGGTSSINGMTYIRGNKRDFENWNKAVGGHWSWPEVLPYFRKSEDNRVKNLDPKYHGTGGYLTVTEAAERDDSSTILFKAAEEIGWKRGDVNGATQTGIMRVQSTIRDGARCSTNKAFLKSADHRPNLHIVTYAYVRKVILETTDDKKIRACGVEFQCSHSQLTALASREVILSAGTVNSPQLLLLSGIGPRQQLAKFNITTIVDTPGVGENLRDPVTLVNVNFVADETFDQCPPENDLQSQLVQWAFNKTGPLADSMGPPSLVAFADTSLTREREDWPDLQFLFTGYYGEPTSQPTVSSDNVVSRVVSLCAPIIMKPQSVGVIRLRSADPVAPPIIEPRYLSNKTDLEVLIRGVNICMQLANTRAVKATGWRLQIKSFPACAQFPEFSDEFIRCTVRFARVSSSHCVGTCKMGKSDDPMAVVDSELRVHNVIGLRVIDASIMPEPTNGNTNAPTILIGEKGSDFIKKNWNFPTDPL